MVQPVPVLILLSSLQAGGFAGILAGGGAKKKLKVTGEGLGRGRHGLRRWDKPQSSPSGASVNVWCELCSRSKVGVQAWGVSKPKASTQELLEMSDEQGKSLSMDELKGDFAPAPGFPVKEASQAPKIQTG